MLPEKELKRLATSLTSWRIAFALAASSGRIAWTVETEDDKPRVLSLLFAGAPTREAFSAGVRTAQ